MFLLLKFWKKKNIYIYIIKEERERERERESLGPIMIYVKTWSYDCITEILTVTKHRWLYVYSILT